MNRINKLVSKENNFTIFRKTESINDSEKDSKKHAISDSE